MFVKKSNLLEQVYDIIVTKQPKEESCRSSQTFRVSCYTLIFTFLLYLFFAFCILISLSLSVGKLGNFVLISSRFLLPPVGSRGGWVGPL